MTELEEKTERLVSMMTREDLGGVLLTLQPNFSWLTGGSSNGIDTSREAGAGALLVRNDGERFVLANRIEMPRLLDEEISSADFQPVEFSWEEEKSSTFLADQARRLLLQNQSLGADAPSDPNTRVIEGVVSACRYQLTEPEIERFRLLGKDAGELVGELMRRLEPGETEKEVARRVQNGLAARDIYCVVCLVAGDDRIQKYRHPVATDRKWRKTLMVVVCARRHGLIASLTRIICIGEQPEDLNLRTSAAAQVNAKLFAATKPGATGAALYDLISKAYTDAGFPNEQLRHHQGGACGYRTRDWVAHPASVDSVHINQAFAWNPSVTGTKVEETCIAFSGGVEIITASPGWPSLSIEVSDANYLLPDVLPR